MQDRNTYRIELDAEPCADVWLSLLGPDGLSQLLHIEAIDPGCRTSPHAESTFYVPGYAGGVLSLDVVGYGGFLRPPTQSYTVRVTRESCPADVNTDGVLDPLDLFEFLDAFFAGAPDGDFNCDRTLNSQDFYDFLNAYLLGC
jgi:hypothetical protein